MSILKTTNFLSNLPSKKQWGRFFKVLSKKERVYFLSFAFLFLASSFFLSVSFYLKNTKEVPAAGGEYAEGAVGSPRFINPVLAASSDVDRDLTELIYSGLMKYDEKGNIVPDLAQKYSVSPDGLSYEFYLKDNLFWQDGTPLTADDVIFTIKTIQNPSFKSPLRGNWLGVKTEKISDSGIRFELSGPSAVFLENTTLKILPQHIWQAVTADNFLLSIYNLKPIGSGPYKLKALSQNQEGYIQSLELVTNPYYLGKSPNIPKINFYFFKTSDEAIRSFNSGKINGLTLVSQNDLKNVKNKNFNEYSFSMPRYFAVFLNQNKSNLLTDDKIREALNYGTDKNAIIKEAILGKGQTVDSPVLPNIYGFSQPEKIYAFDPEKAKSLLQSEGFTGVENGMLVKTISKTPSFQFKSNLRSGSQGTEVRELQKCLAKEGLFSSDSVNGLFGDQTKTAVIQFQNKYADEILKPSGIKSGTGDVLKSTRDKLNELCAAAPKETMPFSLSLATVDQPILNKVASLLKEQWRRLGMDIEIKSYDIDSLEQDVIRPRNYDMLLFGEVLGAIPDPFPFWHSSQIQDPGLNLTGDETKQYDKLLEEARQTLDPNERKNYLEKFQDIFIGNSPAIFLYNPDYLYLVTKNVKGISTGVITDPSKRFLNITDWYISTKRIWK